MLNPLLKKSTSTDPAVPTITPTGATTVESSSAKNDAAMNRNSHLIADPDGRKRKKMEGAIHALLETGIERDKVSMSEFLSPYRNELRRLHKAGKGATLGAIASKLTDMSGMQVSSKVVGEVIRGKVGSNRRQVTKTSTEDRMTSE